MRSQKRIENLTESNRYYKKEYRRAIEQIQSLEDKNDHLEKTLTTINKIPEPVIKKHWLERFLMWTGKKVGEFLGL